MARDILKLVDDTMMERCMKRFTDRREQVACRVGGMLAVHAIRRESSKEGIKGLGIIVSKKTPCEEGFERDIIVTPKNKKVHICRLAKGYRRLEPGDRPVGTPLRRKRKFGPGIEHDDILPYEAARERSSEKARARAKRKRRS